MNSDILNLEAGGWTAAPNCIVRSTKLSGSAKLVYLSLSSRLNYSNGNWPSHTTIASEASCSVATVKRALNELRDAGVIEWQHRTDGDGGRTTNAYRLIVSPTFEATATEPPPF
jgi:predicted transcriptional regulator